MIIRNKKKTEKQSMANGRAKRVLASTFVVICAATLGSGFFFAARQHFSSMDFGMKNSRLRKQIDQLEAEKRRLILAREISLSPMELKKAAKKAGLTDKPTQTASMITSADPVDTKAAAGTRLPEKPFVQKTASVGPVPRAVTTFLNGKVDSDKASKKQAR